VRFSQGSVSVVAARATVGGPGRRQGRLIALADNGGVEGLAGQDAAEEQQGADLDAGGVKGAPGGDLDGGGVERHSGVDRAPQDPARR